ncbi:MAG TPA: bifunctional 2-C-methyl-D-erythritol 4-phosphate cytidylyltransferase/2-C-methyl-D-erythritol 2,4-cyclodiphosphate synthase [Caulobacteraceae bacterium]|nr:bifunctional 2-C-methyl-D-erythritol 4-phosphate cytidylyltransferase/2-C-methyl-D-erythritol 2,4-cyclodiphosphate synthase [Caulobacteraceae bacterium]
MTFSAIVVAAGSGSRAGQGGPKQWRKVGGKTVTRWSVEAFIAAGAKDIVLVAPAADLNFATEIFNDLRRLKIVAGGAERADSVKAGLAALAADGPDIVLIHDAARPFLKTRNIVDLVAALDDCEGAILALPVADTLKRQGADGKVETAPRDGLWRAQTPQAFRYDLLTRAYASWSGAAPPTDEAVVIEAAGGRVRLVTGDPALMKLTYPEDFDMAEAIAGSARLTRVGQGVDAHRFGPGDGVWLCGVKIPGERTLIGHSDADAGLHAITDAILGAIGEGDIGDHFPPTDPQWKGAPSDIFLKHAADLVRQKGGQLINVDVTLICERPKIKPHRQAMRERLAELLGLPVDRVSVKATTTEGMGYTGREEGLLAQAIAAVETPA